MLCGSDAPVWPRRASGPCRGGEVISQSEESRGRIFDVTVAKIMTAGLKRKTPVEVIGYER